MITLRCTKKLLQYLGVPRSDSDHPPTAALGDWYANLLQAGRSRWVLCVSERALLPVILPARKADFPCALSISLRAVLAGLAVPPVEIDREESEMERVEIDRTRSRRVLGVMNDFSIAAEFLLRDGVAPVEVALKVAQTPSKPLDYDSPERVTQSLFASHRAG